MQIFPLTAINSGTDALFWAACAVQMQFLPLNASTQDLTRSFGWDQYGSLMQEDVHEFNKILCDALEEKMKVRGSRDRASGKLPTCAESDRWLDPRGASVLKAKGCAPSRVAPDERWEDEPLCYGSITNRPRPYGTSRLPSRHHKSPPGAHNPGG